MCHTTFSWKTGEIVQNGVIHNPHYYEWMRRTGQQIPPTTQPQQMPQGECIIPLGQMLNRLRTAGYYLDADIVLLTNMHRLYNDIRWRIHELTDVREAQELENLRFKYLTNGMSEEKYKNNILKVERTKVRKRDELQLANLLSTQIMETLSFISHERPRNIVTYISQMNVLREYCNEQFKKIGRGYATSYHVIADTFSHMYLHR
jgi:hypothetical protein